MAWPLACCAVSVTTTIAGSGSAGGSDGSALSASMYYPTAVTVAASGLVYWTEQNGCRLRSYDPTSNTVSTLAGVPGSTSCGYANGAAASSQLSAPLGVTIGPNGDIYWADSGSHTIRMLQLNSSMVVVVAGTANTPGWLDSGTATAALINHPIGLVYHATSGALLWTEQGNHVIRMLLNGAVSTIAGTPRGCGTLQLGTALNSVFGCSSPWDLALIGDVLFISDYDHHVVVQLSTIWGGGTTTVMAGTVDVAGGDNGAVPGGKLNHPTGLAVGNADTLYIGDSSNAQLRFITFSSIGASTAGTLATLAGNGVAGYVDGVSIYAEFNIARGMAVSGGSKPGVYVADCSNHLIRFVSLPTAPPMPPSPPPNPPATPASFGEQP